MPWGPEDVARHNKSAAANPQKRDRWAATATGLLNHGMSESSAIKIANSQVNKPLGNRYRQGGKKS